MTTMITWPLPHLGPLDATVITALVLAAAILFISQAHTTVRYPKELARIGRKPGQTGFSLSTRWQYLTDCSSLYREAYENYSKKGKTVLVPGLGARDEVILPPRAMPWALAQPENKLSSAEALVEINQTRWAFGNSKVSRDLWHGDLVRTHLNLVLETLCAAMNDELALAFDTFFGMETDAWRDIDLLDTIRLVVAQAGNRFTIGDSSEGLKLCRNQGFLDNNVNIFECLIFNGGISGACPKLLRPVVGRLAAWPVWRSMAKFRQYIRPLYEERLQILRLQQKSPGMAVPQDFFQMMLQFAAEHRQEEVNSFEDIAARLCAANFGSMHQTSMQATNLLLNILDSDPEFNTIAMLREEATRFIGKDEASNGAGDKNLRGWTKAKIAAMTRADSVARETLRINAYANRAIFRKVMVDDLITEDGISLPKGSFVSFLSQPANTDVDYYENPLTFDPFRFSRVCEANDDSEGQGAIRFTRRFVSTSDQYLSFGHGKHSCPGRFLVDFELKMMVSYILMHYDIKFPPIYEGRRPRGVWVAEAHLPPSRARIMVRRRSDT